MAGEPARGPHAPYRQMERLPLYAAAAERLLAEDLAYPCYCTPEELEADRKAQEAAKQPPRYVGRCAHLTPRSVRPARPTAAAAPSASASARASSPSTTSSAAASRSTSAISAATSSSSATDGTPLYHFTVVVDDAAMEMTDIIRGEDHLSNTPKHILLFRALGHEVPRFAHLPLILNADRTKMSKRKSQTAIDDYIAEGFIREALVNYLALLGWSTGTEEEILSLDEIVAAVRHPRRPQGRRRVRPRAARVAQRPVDPAPRPDDLIDRLRPFVERGAGRRPDRRGCPSDEELRALLPVVQERLPTLGAIGDLVGFLWVDEVLLDPAMLVPKRWDAATTATGWPPPARRSPTCGAVAFEADELEPPLRALAEARGWKAGDLFMAIRVAVTGRTATPPLFDTLVALGRDRVLARLDRALEVLDGAESTRG